MANLITYTVLTLGECKLHQLHTSSGKVCRRITSNQATLTKSSAYCCIDECTKLLMGADASAVLRHGRGGGAALSGDTNVIPAGAHSIRTLRGSHQHWTHQHVYLLVLQSQALLR
jgi:hypothetical protein